MHFAGVRGSYTDHILLTAAEVNVDEIRGGNVNMSKSGQAFVAKTEGHQFTLYSMMRMMGIPLTKEQEEFQSYLEKTYPAIVGKPEPPIGDVQ